MMSVVLPVRSVSVLKRQVNACEGELIQFFKKNIGFLHVLQTWSEVYTKQCHLLVKIYTKETYWTKPHGWAYTYKITWMRLHGRVWKHPSL